MNEALVTEYVELCSRLVAVDAETEGHFYGRLDQIWYAEMTEADRSEAERRLSDLGSKDRARQDGRRVEDA